MNGHQNVCTAETVIWSLNFVNLLHLNDDDKTLILEALVRLCGCLNLSDFRPHERTFHLYHGRPP